jgi:hypothetical protein
LTKIFLKLFYHVSFHFVYNLLNLYVKVNGKLLLEKNFLNN